MNLVLDFGNTCIKAGLFNGTDLLEKLTVNSPDELISSVESFLPIQHCLIASVTNDHKAVQEYFETKFKILVFTANTPIPLKNLYKSASTLGSDRIAASVGAYSYYPGRNVLTIDAGTCIKYNFVNLSNEFLGGAISPGISMRLKAMHEYTQALPLIEADKNYGQLIGRSTAESLLSGSMIAAACEADAMIDKYKQEFDALQVVVTGGDADYLCKQLKNRFFANQNILLQGLNTILNFNIEK